MARLQIKQKRGEELAALEVGVEVSDSLTSDNSGVAASSLAVKKAWDKAQEAFSKAENALDAVTIADGKADSAYALAEQAKNAADAGVLAMNTALSDMAELVDAAGNLAGLAREEAETAEGKAEQAQADALAAQTAATNAQSTANTAKSTADTAKTTADSALPKTSLSDAVNSNVSTTAATSKAVKTAYDKAVSAETAAGTAQTAATNAQSTANTAKTTADAALPKEVTEQGMPIYKMPWAWYGQTSPEKKSFVMSSVNDAGGSWITRDFVSAETTGYFRYTRYLRVGDGKLAAYSLVITPSGKYLFEIPTPDPSEVGNRGVTAAWVNSKLGTGSSLASLADMDDAPETLEKKKLELAGELNAAASQAIFMGFAWEFRGSSYRISYSLFDQQNLSDFAIQAMRKKDEVFSVPVKSEDGQDVNLELTSEELLSLHDAGVENKKAILAFVAEKKKSLFAAHNETELNEIMAS